MAASSSVASAKMRPQQDECPDALCPIVKLLYMAKSLAESTLHVLNTITPLSAAFVFFPNTVLLEATKIVKLQKWIFDPLDITLMDYDEDGDSKISFVELVECFEAILVNCPCSEIEILFERFKEGNSGWTAIVKDQVDAQLSLIGLVGGTLGDGLGTGSGNDGLN